MGKILFSLAFAAALLAVAFCPAIGDRNQAGRTPTRWPDPWRPEDHWGPITAAVLFLILLAGLIVFLQQTILS
jgi:hypothetical protein